MKDLLISVLGNSSSGKSHTWNTLFKANVQTGKYNRQLYLNDQEYVDIFLVSGSPEEREKYVGDIITEPDPNIVLCSVQYGENTKETYEYFIENEYFLFVHWLNPGYSDQNNPYFDNCGLIDWLLSKQSIVGIRSGQIDPSDRVREIKEYIYGWAQSRNLIKRI